MPRDRVIAGRWSWKKATNGMVPEIDPSPVRGADAATTVGLPARSAGRGPRARGAGRQIERVDSVELGVALLGLRHDVHHVAREIDRGRARNADLDGDVAPRYTIPIEVRARDRRAQRDVPDGISR